MAIRLTGIILFVQDVEKLKSFYTTLFQFTVIEEIENEWVLLKAGDAELGLHKTGDAYLSPEETSSHTENNTKLVLETDEDLAALRKRLIGQGVNAGDIKTWDNFPYRLFDGKDPEGNVFQVRQKKR